MKKEISFIDLFAGIGGIRLGFEKNGFECIFSSEFNKFCAETYFENFGEIPAGDITKINAKNIPTHDVLCAGFPCQPFSAAGEKEGFEDTRGTLFFDILRIIKEKKPNVVFLENVKNLKYHDEGKTLQIILNKLKQLGYFISWEVLNSKDFGVPQTRERIIIVASRKKPFDFSKIKHSNKIVKIKDIVNEGEQFDYLTQKEYTIIDKKHQVRQKTGLMFVGYRNKPIRITGVRPNTHHLSRVHKQCNRIYSSDGVHPTISSTEISGRYHILHKNKVRKLTLNECFKLMGFNEKFKRPCPRAEQYRQIGNSVAIPMIEAVAKEIKNQLF